MLDAAFIRDNLDAVKQNCANRNVQVDVDSVIRLDDERKRLISQAQALQQRANEVSKSAGKVKDAMQTLIGRGYTPIITPDLARVEVLEGIGFMPRDPNPETRQVYTIADTDLCLVGTAEITLGGMHRNQTFELPQLPRKYVGLSHCFRTEAGAPGRDTRGLYRVHQFTKVEMFAFCTSDVKESDAIHLELLAIEETVFAGLGL